MSDKLRINIIITTYDPGDNSRYKLLYQTVQSFVENLKYPNLNWIISDDSASEIHNKSEMRQNLAEMYPWISFSIINTNRRGVGFSKNNALREAFKVSNLVLLSEDDWIFSKPFDLLPHVQLMLDDPTIGMIRLGFLGGDMLARYTDYGNFRTYWQLQPASGFYIYSGQISIRSKYFYDVIGYHAEGLQPGQEEEEFCWRLNRLEMEKWKPIPDHLRMSDIFFSNVEVKNIGGKLYSKTVGDELPKILWPAQYGTVLNCGPTANTGIGISTNSVSPEVK